MARRARLIPVAAKDRVQARTDYPAAPPDTERLALIWQAAKVPLTTVTPHLTLGKVFKPIYEEHLWKTYQCGPGLLCYSSFEACTQDQVGRRSAAIRGCIAAYNGLLTLGITEGSDLYKQAERFGYDTLRVMLGLAKGDAAAFAGIIQRSTREKLSNRDIRSLHDVLRNGGTKEAALKADISTARDCNGPSLSRYVVPLAAPLPRTQTAALRTAVRESFANVPARDRAPEKAPVGTRLPCRVPRCNGQPQQRGICARHYSAARAFVKKGLTTWKKLEALGKVLPAHNKSNNAWLLDENAPGRSEAELRGD